MPQVHFLDVTNRDGVQTARTGLSKFGKTMVNFYLAKLGVAQSEIGFPFLFHEMPYVRANVALAQAGAFGELRLSGWCRAVTADVEQAIPLGLGHYNLSISTSDQMIAHKFRGRLDREAIITEMTAAVAAAKSGGAADDRGQRRGRLAHRRGLPHRVRAGRQGGGRGPGPLLRHHRRGLTAADQGALRQARLRDGDAGGDALPQRPGHGRGELGLRCARRSRRRPGRLGQHLRERHRRALGQRRPAVVHPRLQPRLRRRRPGRDRRSGRPVLGARFGLWASYAFGQPLPQNQPGTGRNAFAHESGIHADGALKDRHNYELYDDDTLGPFPQDWHARSGRVVLTGEYGGMAGFRHVMDGLGIASGEDEDLIFQLVQLCAAATSKPLTDDELRLIAAYPRELSLLYPGQLG